MTYTNVNSENDHDYDHKTTTLFVSKIRCNKSLILQVKILSAILDFNETRGASVALATPNASDLHLTLN